MIVDVSSDPAASAVATHVIETAALSQIDSGGEFVGRLISEQSEAVQARKIGRKASSSSKDAGLERRIRRLENSPPVSDSVKRVQEPLLLVPAMGERALHLVAVTRSAPEPAFNPASCRPVRSRYRGGRFAHAPQLPLVDSSSVTTSVNIRVPVCEHDDAQFLTDEPEVVARKARPLAVVRHHPAPARGSATSAPTLLAR